MILKICFCCIIHRIYLFIYRKVSDNKLLQNSSFYSLGTFSNQFSGSFVKTHFFLVKGENKRKRSRSFSFEFVVIKVKL